jgi:hypothetical protein
MVHFITICVLICFIYVVQISTYILSIFVFYSLACVSACFLERAVPVQVFQKYFFLFESPFVYKLTNTFSKWCKVTRGMKRSAQ